MDRTAIGLLILRIFAGGLMLWEHGWGKLAGFKANWGSFPNPLGVGSEITQIISVFAEFFCALAVLVGFKTKFAAIPVVLTMLVAAFVVHAGDPLSRKELALLYASAFAALALMGGGRYALKD